MKRNSSFIQVATPFLLLTGHVLLTRIAKRRQKDSFSFQIPNEKLSVFLNEKSRS
jgi:hypothetical protein